MVYKVTTNEVIKDDNTTSFYNVVVGVLESAAATGGGLQGSTSGYTSGGRGTPTPSYYNIIDKFPFSSDANATDVGDLTQARGFIAGNSSSEKGELVTLKIINSLMKRLK